MFGFPLGKHAGLLMLEAGFPMNESEKERG